VSLIGEVQGGGSFGLGLASAQRSEGAYGANAAELVSPANSTTASGRWRADLPFVAGREGLRITLKRERGVTPPGFLQVPFRFQAPPLDRWGRTWEFSFDTYTTIAAGEQPRAGGPMLERPTLQTMFLDEDLRFMLWNGSLDVQRMLDELKAILHRPAPFRLTIGQPGLWGPKPLLSMVAVFTSIQPEQRGGEVGTEYANVEFLQWPHDPAPGRRRPSESDSGRRYTLEDGDTLYTIAKRVYKRASAWGFLASANGISGVSPDSASELARWASRHERKTLKVPPLSSRTATPSSPNTASGSGHV
jgi:hypothetical protein